MEILCLILFLALFVSWFILPDSKKAQESNIDFTSIGDETRGKATVS